MRMIGYCCLSFFFYFSSSFSFFSLFVSPFLCLRPQKSKLPAVVERSSVTIASICLQPPCGGFHPRFSLSWTRICFFFKEELFGKFWEIERSSVTIASICLQPPCGRFHPRFSLSWARICFFLRKNCLESFEKWKDESAKSSWNDLPQRSLSWTSSLNKQFTYARSRILAQWLGIHFHFSIADTENLRN